MNRCRKVFMIGWEYPPRITGGLAIACRGIARSLSALGHRVDFLIPRLSDGSLDDQGVRVFAPEPEFFTDTELTLYAEQWRRFQGGDTPSPYDSTLVEPAAHRAGDASHPAASTGTRVYGVERSVMKLAAPLLEGGYGDHIYREIHAFAQLATLLAAKGDYDIIHAHDWMTFPAALSAAHATGLPVVCHIHATEFDRSGERVNQYIYDLERHALLACHHIITVSNYTRNILIDRYSAPPAKITAVHNAVEFELPETSRARIGDTIGSETFSQAVRGSKSSHAGQQDPNVEFPRDRIVLFLGRITFQKGPDYFVRAARKVVEQLNGSRVRFVMVGAGDMYARMIELAADLGIGKYFHYTGFLNREQVQRIYAMSDLYVMPSVSEPFGISPLEAMVHGVPVIVSKQSGVSEVISNCIKVDFWDVDAIAGAIVRVLEDGQDRARLQENGRAEVSQITWSAAADGISEVYEKLLDDASGSTTSIAPIAPLARTRRSDS